MSRLLEAARNKPPELTRVGETLKALAAERERAFEVLDELNTELREARKVLEVGPEEPRDEPGQRGAPGGHAQGREAQTRGAESSSR